MKAEELKSRIKELNDYFVEKLVNGEYEVVESDKYKIMVNVNGYKFNIWIANGESYVQTYGQGFKDNLMELFFNEAQKSTIYENLTRDKTKMALMAEIENKQREIEQLKSRLSKV